jgi:hypothetical protein
LVVAGAVVLAVNAGVTRYKEALDDSLDPSLVQAASLGFADVTGATALTEAASGLEIGSGRRLSNEERLEQTGQVLGAYGAGITTTVGIKTVRGLGEAVEQGVAEGITLAARELAVGRPAGTSGVLAEIVTRPRVLIVEENADAPGGSALRSSDIPSDSTRSYLDFLAKARKIIEAKRQELGGSNALAMTDHPTIRGGTVFAGESRPFKVAVTLEDGSVETLLLDPRGRGSQFRDLKTGRFVKEPSQLKRPKTSELRTSTQDVTAEAEQFKRAEEMRRALEDSATATELEEALLRALIERRRNK